MRRDREVRGIGSGHHDVIPVARANVVGVGCGSQAVRLVFGWRGEHDHAHGSRRSGLPGTLQEEGAQLLEVLKNCHRALVARLRVYLKVAVAREPPGWNRRSQGRNHKNRVNGYKKTQPHKTSLHREP